MMLETIVLAADGSESSDRAAEYAQALAKDRSARIIAVHVVEHFPGRRGAAPVHGHESEIQTRLRQQVDALVGSGINARLEIVDTVLGGPAPVIADIATREQADVIVTGTRGHSPIAGLTLGSVAQRLLHVAPCPVLVIPAPPS